MASQQSLVALVSWPSAPLNESLVRRSLDALDFPPSITSSPIKSFSKLLQWSTYDAIDHELTHNHRENVLSSSYTFRKALIRKHFLSRCLRAYSTKHSSSILNIALPQTWEMEISFADELEEMWGDELWELGEALEDRTKWWILKPGMADRGMGIRMFNSKDSLRQIFEEFEGESDEDESELNDTSVVTSQLRHFVIQEYLSPPLLLDPAQVPINKETIPRPPHHLHGHKFHLRAYCIASGALTLYLYPRVLALFSTVPYSLPDVHDAASAVDLAPHLTNTSLQTHRGEEGVRLLDELIGCRILHSTGQADPKNLTSQDIAGVVDQMSDILAETFKAAIQMPVHFQPLQNAFELYGVDFLVIHAPDSDNETPSDTSSVKSSLQVKLLEVNAEPAIELTGPRLTWILEDLFASIGKVCIAPFFATEQQRQHQFSSWGIGETRHGLRKCLEAEVRGSSP